jgi:hypothetical protein
MARTYLEDLYGSADTGYFSLAEFRGPAPTAISWFPVSDVSGAARLIAAAADEGRTVYAGMGLRTAPLPRGRRGGADSVCGILGIWGDVDYRDPLAHKREDLPSTPEAALAIIREATPLPPSMIVDSGFGFYPLLLFREFWHFDDADERARAAPILRRYNQALGAKAGDAHVDPAGDLARVLKVPGSINWKVAGDPRPVRIIHDGGPRYTVDELEEMLPQLAAGTRGDPPPYAGSRGPLLPDELEEAVRIFAPWHRDGARHFSSMHVAGWCGLAGFEEKDTAEIVRRLSVNDRNPKDREKAVRDTYQRLSDGKPVSGFYGLRDAVGMDTESLERLEALRERYRDRTSAALDVPPFPTQVLPGAARRFVAASAVAIGCPDEFVAVPLVALAEGTMGKSRRLVIRAGFEVSPGSWYGVIADPGTGKSPGMKYAMRIVAPLQDEAWRRYQDRLAEWEATPKDERGEKPTPEHYFITDSTGEALWAALASSPGVTQVEDELRRRLKALDAYRQAGDRQTMLGLWSNAAVKVVRRTSSPVYIPFPVAPMVGGIQPGVLGRLRGEGEDAAADDGWVPRFLLCWPDAEPLALSDVAFDASTVGPVVEIFRGLRLNRATPHDTMLSTDAYALFKTWHAENRHAQMVSRGLERQWAAKAPIHLARLALVLHLLAWPNVDKRDLSADTMHDAITLLEYFRGHLDRVLPAFGVTAGSGIKTRIIRILRTSKTRTVEGWVTRSAVLKELRNVTREDFTAALDCLLAVEIVEKDVQPTATKPVERWRLTPVPSENTVGNYSRYSDYSQQETTADDTDPEHGRENTNNANNTNGVEKEIERVASILRTFTAEDLAGFRVEVATASDDDTNAAIDRAALALLDGMDAEEAAS